VEQPVAMRDVHLPGCSNAAGLPVSEGRFGEVHLWHFDLDAPCACHADLARAVTTAELGRASQFATPLLRHRALSTRATLRCLIAAYLQHPPHDIELSTGAHGKPVLASRHASALQFNLSHTDSHLLIAVTDNRRVGVDIERRRPMPEWRELARRVLAQEEIDSLLQMGEGGAMAFIDVWTRKEACIKATGEGLMRDLRSFTLPCSPRQLRWRVSLPMMDAPAVSLEIHALDIGAECSGALAVEGECAVPIYV
jgi:4'-phosphopantetheinyl transferase